MAACRRKARNRAVSVASAPGGIERPHRFTYGGSKKGGPKSGGVPLNVPLNKGWKRVPPNTKHTHTHTHTRARVYSTAQCTETENMAPEGTIFPKAWRSCFHKVISSLTSSSVHCLRIHEMPKDFAPREKQARTSTQHGLLSDLRAIATASHTPRRLGGWLSWTWQPHPAFPPPALAGCRRWPPGSPSVGMRWKEGTKKG